MSSQSSSPEQGGVHPLATMIVAEMVTDLHARYSVASGRVGGRVYHDLARVSEQMKHAVGGPNPVGELRALAWVAPSDGVSEVVTNLASLIEGAGR